MKRKKFLVTKTDKGVVLELLIEKEGDLTRESYELRDGEIIELLGEYPIIKRF